MMYTKYVCVRYRPSLIVITIGGGGGCLDFFSFFVVDSGQSFGRLSRVSDGHLQGDKRAIHLAGLPRLSGKCLDRDHCECPTLGVNVGTA